MLMGDKRRYIRDREHPLSWLETSIEVPDICSGGVAFNKGLDVSDF